jgi:hypothetical protein
MSENERDGEDRASCVLSGHRCYFSYESLHRPLHYQLECQNKTSDTPGRNLSYFCLSLWRKRRRHARIGGPVLACNKEATLHVRGCNLVPTMGIIISHIRPYYVFCDGGLTLVSKLQMSLSFGGPEKQKMQT